MYYFLREIIKIIIKKRGKASMFVLSPKSKYSLFERMIRKKKRHPIQERWHWKKRTLLINVMSYESSLQIESYLFSASTGELHI